MARRRKTRRTRRDSHGGRQGAPVSLVDRLLHLQAPDVRPWKFLLPVLVLAFAVRAAVALCGDFVLHPDEVMQYLEPAHRLVFGGGVTYWEFFYGARAWLVPGMVAGVLKGFDLCWTWRAVLVCGRCQADVLCNFSADSGGDVFFLRGGILGSYRRGSRCWPVRSGMSWRGLPTSR